MPNIEKLISNSATVGRLMIEWGLVRVVLKVDAGSVVSCLLGIVSSTHEYYYHCTCTTSITSF